METYFKNAKVVASGYSSELYHKQEAKRGTAGYVVSRSALVEFSHCPHRWRAGYKDDGTTATEFGLALDCVLLTPKRFELDYAVTPVTYTDEKTGEEKPWTFAAKVCKKWKEEHEGKTIIKRDVWENVLTAAHVADEDEVISVVLKSAETQLYITADYFDSTTGLTIPVKTLIDIVPAVDGPWGRTLWDLKSARDASATGWPKVIYSNGYAVQAAMILDLYAAARPGEKRDAFYHAVVENVAPFEPGRRVVGDQFIDLGRRNYQMALNEYAVCVKENRWPGYDTQRNGEQYQGCTICSPDSWMLGMK
jgi:hypothetical protein